MSLMSEFRCLDIKTHRITFRKFPIQTIRKENRLIVRAGHGKLFLLTDISSAELTILKWFVNKYQGVDFNELSGLTFTNLSDQLNLTRDVIKSLTYPFLYGASIETMSKETGQSESVVKRFRKNILEFPGVKKFRQKAITYAQDNGMSLPTALGHQFPIFGDPNTQGLSLLIQGTGAELLRSWVLEVNKIGKAPEISNIIHDEIIMEVYEDNVIQRIPQIDKCLKKAQRKILPGIKLLSKSTISNSWDKSRGFTFSIGFLRHLP